MKMKWFDRVLLALVLILFIGVGVFAIGIALGPLRPLFESFYALMTNGLLVNVLILTAVGLVMLLAALRVLYAHGLAGRESGGRRGYTYKIQSKRSEHP